MFRALTVVALLLLNAFEASAMTLGGPAIAATQIVNDLLADATTAGAAFIGIGLVVLAFAWMAGLPIERFASTIIAGSLLAAGSTVTTMVLGATIQ